MGARSVPINITTNIIVINTIIILLCAFITYVPRILQGLNGKILPKKKYIQVWGKREVIKTYCCLMSLSVFLS